MLAFVLPCMFALFALLWLALFALLFMLALPLVCTVTLALLMVTFALLALVFAVFELFAFAFPFALSAGVQAVQTLATARRGRSASVLRIEFPPVPRGVSLLGSCAGLSLALKVSGVILAARLIEFTLKGAHPPVPTGRFGGGLYPAACHSARRGATHGSPVYTGPRKNLRRAI